MTTNVADLLKTFKDVDMWFASIPEELRYFAKSIKKRLNNEKDLVIAITGHEEGIGKSSFSILLGFLIDLLHFDLQKNIAYVADSETIKKQFWGIEQGSYLSLDEAIKALYKMDFNSALQKILITMYATERWQRKATGLCISRLTEQFRNHKVRFWVKIMKRGYAVVHIKDVDDYSDPWKLDWERKYRAKHWGNKKVVEISFAERMNMERAKSTYLIEFRIPELPRVVFGAYEAIKREQHNDDANKDDETARMMKLKEHIFKLCKYIKKEDASMNIPKLAGIMELSDTGLREIITRFGSIDEFKKEKKINEMAAQIRKIRSEVKIN